MTKTAAKATEAEKPVAKTAKAKADDTDKPAEGAERAKLIAFTDGKGRN